MFKRQRRPGWKEPATLSLIPDQLDEIRAAFIQPFPVVCVRCGRTNAHHEERPYAFLYKCRCGTQAMVFKDNYRVVFKFNGETRFHAFTG